MFFWLSPCRILTRILAFSAFSCALLTTNATDPPSDFSPLSSEEAPEAITNETATSSDPATEKTVTTASGTTITYLAKHVSLALLEEDGTTEKGSIFYTEYIATKIGDTTATEARPLLFCFNGGPGSSSVWLHLGAWGPQVIPFEEQGLEAPSLPVELIENPDCLLDVADLVFVDPIGTGFSRATGETDAKEFWNLQADLNSCTELITRYLTENKRWSSPVFLAGESYGAMRVAGLAEKLQSAGVALSGVALISGILDFATIADELIATACFLPTYTTTTAYHLNHLRTAPQHYQPHTEALLEQLQQNLPRTPLVEIAAKAEFPVDLSTESLVELHEETVKTLAKNSHYLLFPGLFSEEEAAPFLQLLSHKTGINQELILASNLRLNASLYRDQLLPDFTLGRFDSRVFAPDHSPFVQYAQTDPSFELIYSAFSNATNSYLRETLTNQEPLNYTILGGVRWSWDQFANRYVQVTDTLDEALRTNPDLQLFVALGLFDLATPPEAIRYSLRSLEHGQGRWQERWYQGGHMMYLHAQQRALLSQDLRQFLQQNLVD